MSKGKKGLKVAGLVIGALVLLFISFTTGVKGAEVTLKEKKMDAIEMDKEIATLQKEKKDLTAEVDSVEKEKKEVMALIDSKSEVEKDFETVKGQLKDTKGTLAKELEAGRIEIDKKLEQAKSELTDAQADVKDTNASIEAKNAELATLEGRVQKAKGQPKTLSAGKYTVGQDLPEGRYIATPIGTGSNFVVYSSGGSLEVNTILGSYGEASYTFFADEGSMIETEAQVKLTPIE
ncbi:hypothetical protein [Sporosarcina sp. A2]|uniref:hypothetical protein n=1 Tax=Sporosarcina sp. A2 TaxID=3393449 RepID=UPI003D7A2992